MIKKILLCAIAMMGTAYATEEVSVDNLTTEPIEVSSQMTRMEQKVRDNSVRVVTWQGHGSGGIIRYKDIQLVLTAQHVASDGLGTQYLLQTPNEQRAGFLIYSDPLHDIALIYVPRKFEAVKGIKWNPITELSEVGTEITYSGYPSWHSLMTYRGRVAGYETHPHAGTQIMLNTYGWFGCSGSLIYDVEGRMVGILWGIDLQRGLPQENMIWVAPMQNLDMKLALKPLCTGLTDKPKACRGI